MIRLFSKLPLAVNAGLSLVGGAVSAYFVVDPLAVATAALAAPAAASLVCGLIGLGERQGPNNDANMQSFSANGMDMLKTVGSCVAAIATVQLQENTSGEPIAPLAKTQMLITRTLAFRGAADYLAPTPEATPTRRPRPE